MTIPKPNKTSKTKTPIIATYRIDEQAEKIMFPELEVLYDALFSKIVHNSDILESINRGNYNNIKEEIIYD